MTGVQTCALPILALAIHLLILVVILGSVCVIGMGLSAATARTSASAVLTYLVVAALVIGTPLATAISTTAVRGEQRQTIYYTDYDSSTNDWRVCDEPERRTEDVVHTNNIVELKEYNKEDSISALIIIL